ncbi:hypothetical protein MASR2M39_14400 [Ignavibacteriales bacterium]
MFDWFKKKKKAEEAPQYDVTNLKVTDLRKGFIFDLEGKSWEVTKEYEYDWGDDFFTLEFQVKSVDTTAYLHVEEDDEIEITVTKEVDINNIDKNLVDEIIEQEKPKRTIEFSGRTFFRKAEAAGNFRDLSGNNWDPFISWDYRDETGKYLLSIEQWGEDEFEASIGRVVEEYEITNIFPGNIK